MIIGLLSLEQVLGLQRLDFCGSLIARGIISQCYAEQICKLLRLFFFLKHTAWNLRSFHFWLFYFKFKCHGFILSNWKFHRKTSLVGTG